jgi:hypothetical protein
MTTPSPTTARAGDDLLIQEALRQRQRHRSGKSLSTTLSLTVFLGGVGYLLAFRSGVITYSMPYPTNGFPLGGVLVVLGVLVFLAAAVFLANAVTGARPGAPWGDPAAGECPVCGQPGLRQDGILLREGGTLKTSASGTVTLCETPDCPHSAVEAQD